MCVCVHDKTKEKNNSKFGIVDTSQVEADSWDRVRST